MFDTCRGNVRDESLKRVILPAHRRGDHFGHFGGRNVVKGTEIRGELDDLLRHARRFFTGEAELFEHVAETGGRL